MSDVATETAQAEAEPVDPKIAKATEIYTTWRNTHWNNISPASAFSQIDALAHHLIAAIAAAL